MENKFSQELNNAEEFGPIFEKAEIQELDKESDIEESKEICEEFQGKRAGILKAVLDSRTTETLLNLMPIVGQLKMGVEGIVGRTLTDKRPLSARERFDYVAITGALTIASGLALAGMGTEALAIKGVGVLIGSIELTPTEFKHLAEKSRERFPKTANILDKIADFVNDKKSLVESLSKEFLNSLRNLPSETLAS